MKKILSAIILIMTVTFLLPSCHTIDDDRVPVTAVNIVFNTVADWNIYGVAAATDYRRFIRDERIPANFPYTASTFTGYGGILLVCDVLGNPQAFDLCCPVEVKPTVRVAIDKDSQLAKCPVCGSTYDVFSLPGTPVGGKAADYGYGLRRYNVRSSANAYKTVTY